MAAVTNLQRVASLALGLLMIACGVVLLLVPKEGLIVVAIVLAAALVLFGARLLVYYITMARHMVGGLAVLIISIIALDVGVFGAALVVESPLIATAMYLSTYNTIVGFLSIARGVESKLFGSPWVWLIVHGLVSIALAGLCIAFINSNEIIIWVFCIGLFYNAGARLVSVFKPPDIIYIQ